MNTYEKVKAIADERKESISAIENGAGIGNAVIAGWKSSSPNVKTLKAVADYMGVSIEELIGD